MLVRFRLLADGAPAEESTIMVRGALWRDMWFAREPLTAGTAFNSGRPGGPPHRLPARARRTARQRRATPT